MRIPSGVTDQYVYFVAVDATDLATRETGLSTWTVYRSRNGGAAAAMTTPTINETDSTNMPGVYELLLDEDMTIDSGDDSQEMVFHITHAGMAPVTRTIELYRPKITAGNTLDVTATGEAGLDFANVALATGGMPALGIVDAGTAQSATGTTLVLRAAAGFANDELIGATIVITGGTGAGQARVITDYVGSTDTATVDTWTTTPSGTITYIVVGTPPASATSVPAVNVVQVGGATTDVSALATNVAEILVDTGTTLDGKLNTIDDFLDTEVAAIKAKTDSLTFTVAGQVDANIQRVNDVAITGDGSATPFNVA